MRTHSPFGIGLFVSLVLGVSTAFSQVQIHFVEAADYNGNFREAAGASSMAYDGTLPSMRFTQSSSTSPAVAMYDTTPANASELDFFAAETVRINFSVNASLDSVGILMRLNSSGADGYLALVNLSTSVGGNQLRLFDGATTSGAAGTQSAVALATTGNLLTPNQLYSLELNAVNIGPNVQLDAAIYHLNDFGGSALYEVSYLDTSAASQAAGQIGVRFGSNGAANSMANVTYFAIVPEPSLAALMGLAAGVFCFARPRGRLVKRVQSRGNA